MDYATYRIIHLVGVAAVALGLGGIIANGANRKAFVILQGVALLVMLVSGFGMLAKHHLGFPHFAMVKLALLVVAGGLPTLFRKFQLPFAGAVTISLVLIGILAWLGTTMPALW